MASALVHLGIDQILQIEQRLMSQCQRIRHQH